jgi:hypothetical protein
MLLSKRAIELESQNLELKDSPKLRVSDLLDDLFAEINFHPYKKDAAGNIIHNAKGRAMLDWGNIFATVTRLIGKLIAVYYVRNRK